MLLRDAIVPAEGDDDELLLVLCAPRAESMLGLGVEVEAMREERAELPAEGEAEVETEAEMIAREEPSAAVEWKRATGFAGTTDEALIAAEEEDEEEGAAAAREELTPDADIATPPPPMPLARAVEK